jgi:hypothetical protein
VRAGRLRDAEQEQQASKRTASRGKEKTKMQEEGRKSGADKLWARRCELERRIERRVKMIENVDKVLEAIGMSSMKEAGKLQEEKKKIRVEINKLRREIWKVDGEVRWAEAFEDAYREKREAKEAKKAKAEQLREEEEEERERMRDEYWD